MLPDPTPPSPEALASEPQDKNVQNFVHKHYVLRDFHNQALREKEDECQRLREQLEAAMKVIVSLEEGKWNG